MGKMRQTPLVRLERVRQQGALVEPAPSESQGRQHQNSDSHGFVACDQGDFLAAQGQAVGELDEHELRDDQRYDDPMKALGNNAPTGSGVSDRHASKLKRVNTTCTMRVLGVAAAMTVLTLVGCARPV